MDENQKRGFFFEALLRESAPEPKPEPPGWWKYLLSQKQNQTTIPPRPNPLARLSLEPPYVYPFKDADKAKVLAVWCMGTPIPGYDPAVMRYDCEGSIMLYSQHGNCDSEYGWQIDHIHPRSKGGSDLLSNLQPLNWRNNQRKKDKVILPPPVRRPLSL